jgi:hypothetical protein
VSRLNRTSNDALNSKFGGNLSPSAQRKIVENLARHDGFDAAMRESQARTSSSMIRTAVSVGAIALGITTAQGAVSNIWAQEKPGGDKPAQTQTGLNPSLTVRTDTVRATDGLPERTTTGTTTQTITQTPAAVDSPRVTQPGVIAPTGTNASTTTATNTTTTATNTSTTTGTNTSATNVSGLTAPSAAMSDPEKMLPVLRKQLAEFTQQGKDVKQIQADIAKYEGELKVKITGKQKDLDAAKAIQAATPTPEGAKMVDNLTKEIADLAAVLNQTAPPVIPTITPPTGGAAVIDTNLYNPDGTVKPMPSIDEWQKQQQAAANTQATLTDQQTAVDQTQATGVQTNNILYFQTTKAKPWISHRVIDLFNAIPGVAKITPQEVQFNANLRKVIADYGGYIADQNKVKETDMKLGAEFNIVISSIPDPNSPFDSFIANVEWARANPEATGKVAPHKYNKAQTGTKQAGTKTNTGTKGTRQSSTSSSTSTTTKTTKETKNLTEIVRAAVESALGDTKANIEAALADLKTKADEMTKTVNAAKTNSDEALKLAKEAKAEAKNAANQAKNAANQWTNKDTWEAAIAGAVAAALLAFGLRSGHNRKKENQELKAMLGKSGIDKKVGDAVDARMKSAVDEIVKQVMAAVSGKAPPAGGEVTA